MKKKFKVSVIIPIYNVEKYLEETLQSVINQTIGFKDNIEMILVNDGSPDNSEEICLKYKEKYPNNIIYIKQKNSGVSSSRNKGLEVATSPYILFLDSDDYISKNFIQLSSKFLDKETKVDFVISRVRLFEEVNKWHYLDYRFKSSIRIANTEKNIDFCQYHSTGVLIRKSALKDIRFNTTVKYGEDMRFMSELLLNNNLFGIEKRITLYYRKRKTNNSAVNMQISDPSYYINTLENSFKYIFDACIEKYGKVPKYFQYFIMNSLSERFKSEPPNENILKKIDKEKYVKIFKFLLDNISDEIIISQKRMNINSKVECLKIKHGKSYEIKIDINNRKYYINGIECPVKSNEFIRILKVKKDKNNIAFYIDVNDYLFENKINVIVDNKKMKLERVNDKYIDDIKNLNYYSYDFKKIYTNKRYIFKINKDNKKIEFKLKNNNLEYGVCTSVVKHNALPKKSKKIFNRLLIFNKYNIKNIKLFKKILSIYYLCINGIYTINKNGFINTLKKAGENYE
jgi:glycosyltransferase involved in cell wall biosynthesis